MIDFSARKKYLRWTFWILLFEAILSMGIGTLYLKAANLPADLLAKIFLTISFPAHFATLAFLVFPFIALSVLVWPNRRFVMTVAILSGTL